ncbi:hypothetical protein BJ546DRAFT_48346 [Cryomyces antarcticus]
MQKRRFGPQYWVLLRRWRLGVGLVDCAKRRLLVTVSTCGDERRSYLALAGADTVVTFRWSIRVVVFDCARQLSRAMSCCWVVVLCVQVIRVSMSCLCRVFEM